MKKDMNGIRGWLLVFVICLAISIIYGGLSIISLLITYIFSGLISGFLVIVLILMMIIPFSLLLMDGIFILRKYKKAIKFTIFVLIFNIVWFLVELGFMAMLGSNLLSGFWLASFITNLIWTVIWVIYFKKSKRVKNTLIR